MNSLLLHLAEIMEENTWLMPLFSFLGGVLGSLSACSLSSLPLIISHMMREEDRSAQRTRKICFCYCLGNMLCFTLLAFLTVLFHKALRFPARAVNLILAVLMLWMGLEMWEIVQLIPVSGLLSKNTKTGLFGAFLEGALSAVASSPCTTPILTFLLTLTAARGSILLSALCLLLYGLGNCLIVFPVAFSVGFVQKIKQNRLYPKAEKILRLFTGSVMLLMGFWFFWQAV